jgi:hypothetical protein
MIDWFCLFQQNPKGTSTGIDISGRLLMFTLFKKQLTISTWSSEAVNRRRLDNRQYNGQKEKDKHTKMIYKTLHMTLKVEQHESK